MGEDEGVEGAMKGQIQQALLPPLTISLNPSAFNLFMQLEMWNGSV